MRWTEADKKRVRAIIDHITAGDSQAAFAREIGATSRSTVNNWRRRGMVSVEYIPAVIKAALPMVVLASQLNPDARIVANTLKPTKKAAA
ncbi:MAG: hypothetical protein V4641_05500 [Pseudomonadota bacterium]